MSGATTDAPKAPEGTLDPTTFAVIFNAMSSCVAEMSLTFEYSAWSSIVAEARDFSCAVYDAAFPPNALFVLDGLPIFVNSQPVALEETAKFFGAEEICDGDIIVLNGPYYGGTHVGDLVVVCPVFSEGEHLFWAAATGYHMDIGSAWNTSVPVYAPDAFGEGLHIPPLKLEERGKLRRDVLNLFLENVRYHDFVEGDLMSQVGSVKTARKRLLDLVDKWGQTRCDSSRPTSWHKQIDGRGTRSRPGPTAPTAVRPGSTPAGRETRAFVSRAR